MPFGVKIVFTIFMLIIALGFIFIDPGVNNAGPDWFWRGGKNDLLRTILMREDGKFRKYTKLGGLVYFLLSLYGLSYLLNDGGMADELYDRTADSPSATRHERSLSFVLWPGHFRAWALGWVARLGIVRCLAWRIVAPAPNPPYARA